jgi:hypothetical protein
MVLHLVLARQAVATRVTALAEECAQFEAELLLFAAIRVMPPAVQK